jgi:hypothetical protein
MSLWSEKARTGTHLMSGRLSNNPTDRVSKMYERVVLCQQWGFLSKIPIQFMA